MNKELEALYKLKKVWVSRYDGGFDTLFYETKEFKIIETALEEKEQFEELVGMNLGLFMQAVNIKLLLENARKEESILEDFE